MPADRPGITAIFRRIGLALAAAALTISAGTATADTGTTVYEPPLQVCADPNNMPFSDAAGDGFENKLATMVAKDLGTTVAYTWLAQRRGFVRDGLAAGACQLVMGTPNIDGLATTTRYYRSSYVFVSRADRDLTFSAMTAPQLRSLKIGVHLVGDDGANTPPAAVLASQGIVDNVVGYSIYGDYRKPSPPSRLIEAVSSGAVDIAAVWGPLAGYYARLSPVPLRIVPITDTTKFYPQLFEYSIAMGVRPDDDELRRRLNGFIARHQTEIDTLLASYGVPQLVDGGN